MSEPEPKKPAKHGRKREDILDGALKYISVNGLENTGLKDIASYLGMTHPALYYYFKSKDQLVFEAVRKAMAGLITDLEESQAGLLDNPEVQLMALCTAHIEYELVRVNEVAFVNAFMYGTLKTSTTDDEEHRSQIRDMQRSVLNLYRSRVEHGQETGQFIAGDSTQMAFGVLGLVSYTVSWYRPEGHLSIGATARSVAAQALRSITAKFG